MPSRFWQVAHFGFGVSYRVPQVTQDWLFLDIEGLLGEVVFGEIRFISVPPRKLDRLGS